MYKGIRTRMTEDLTLILSELKHISSQLQTIASLLIKIKHQEKEYWDIWKEAKRKEQK